MEDHGQGVLDRIRMAGDPVADTAAQVVLGNARFTVLTARLLRLEWSPGGAFEDRGTYAFPNRRGPLTAYEVREEDGATVIDTGALVLRHTPDGEPLHRGNTSIEVAGPPHARWVPGLVDRHNLGGARRTVDRCRGEASLEPGLASRSGWAVVDDSGGVVFSPVDGWPVARPGDPDRQDLYFFGHGHDYAGAVTEYTRFGGAIPPLPRWILGAWWSRYWPYSQDDVRRIAGEFRAHDLPLDVFVLDMDWHTTDSWTGYSWNRELFPDPRTFLAWLHEQHLHTTLNLHPALGVGAFEDAYGAFAAATGADTSERAPIPFRIADRDFVRNYFELLHHPLEDDGVDFWWMDWQQGNESEIPGLDPLPWLNHLHFQDMRRRPDRRPITFSRWGGLGSHRYPVGFSGDSFSLWRALRFQPRYTAAGANVAYAWWSHDIGGHVGAVDPELYVRWLQFGALSPALRLHSTNAADNERLPWRFGDEVLEHSRAAFHLRYELMPYLYTASRIAADTGIAPVRPTSWIAPDHDGAYVARDQFLLGDDVIAAPVMYPVAPGSGLAPVNAWLPQGEWIERTTGETFTGPRWVRLVADLGQVPQFVRPGTVLPLAEVAPSTAEQDPDHLVLAVFGGADGTGRLFEDDGVSLDPPGAWTTFTTTTPDPSRCAVRVHAAEGDGATGDRRTTLRLHWTRPPARVTLEGAAHENWRFDEASATTVVEVPPRPRTEAFEVVVEADGPLSARGPEHDAAVRDADLRVLADDDEDGPEAIARRGGPAVHVVEHTAPEEAAAVLGRVVVAAAEHGPQVVVEAVWRLEHGPDVRTVAVEPMPVPREVTVLDAPWAWDGTTVSARWSVDVTVRWGDVELRHRHESLVLSPTICAYRLAITAGDDPPADWEPWAVEPGDIDFPELAAPCVLQLRLADPQRREAGVTAHAAATVVVPEDRELAFSYAAAGPVTVRVDGATVEPDVHGIGPVPFYTLHPRLRTTAAVALAAGRHEVVFACPKADDLPSHDWYLWASAVDPADGSVLLDVVAEHP